MLHHHDHHAIRHHAAMHACMQISAQIAIYVKKDPKPGKAMPEWEETAAVSCAVQNMWLMATALGLAGYWTSWQVRMLT